jgi:hypothetical protein
MACTIVRNAGKHATFGSLTMTTGSEWIARIVCQLDGDPRLIAGASVIVAHVSREAGFSDAAASEIAEAAADACGAASRVLGESGIPATMRLAASEFPDRIEVTIEPSPEIVKEFRAQFASGPSKSFADQIRQSLQSAAVDELDVEVSDGTPRVMLVKKSGAAKRRFVF